MMTTRQIKIVNFSALPWFYSRVFPRFGIFLCSELSPLRLNLFFLSFLLLCSRGKSSDRFCRVAVSRARVRLPHDASLQFLQRFWFHYVWQEEATPKHRTTYYQFNSIKINLISAIAIYAFHLNSVGDWRITSRTSVADTCGNGCATLWWRKMCRAWVFIKSFCHTNKYKTVLKAWAKFRKDRVTTNFNNKNCDAEKILIFIFCIFVVRHFPSCSWVSSIANKFSLYLSHRYFPIRRTWCNEMINE